MPVQTPVPPKPAEPPARCTAALSVFTAANIHVEQGREPTEPWRIAGKYNFWPLSGRWAADGTHPLGRVGEQRQGYGAVDLRNLIQQEALNPEALAAVAAALDPTAAPLPEVTP